MHCETIYLQLALYSTSCWITLDKYIKFQTKLQDLACDVTIGLFTLDRYVKFTHR